MVVLGLFLKTVQIRRKGLARTRLGRRLDDDFELISVEASRWELEEARTLRLSKVLTILFNNHRDCPFKKLQICMNGISNNLRALQGWFCLKRSFGTQIRSEARGFQRATRARS